MKKHVLLLLCFLTFFLSCKDKVNDEKILNNQKKDTINIDVEGIKNLIKLQKNANYIDYRPDNPYLPSEKDLLVLIPFVERELKSRGFKTISNVEFDKKINSLVKNTKIKIKNYEEFTTIFTNDFDKKDQSLDEYEFEFDTYNQFAIKKYNFMIPILFLQDVIKIKKNSSYSVTIPQYVVARNKYLFNNSKDDLNWLLVNDKDFLKNLVIYLGYDREPQINKMVLEEYYQVFSGFRPIENEKIGTFLFTKDWNKKFQVRQGLVDYIKNNTTVNDNRFIYALHDYTFHLYDKDLDGIYGANNPLKMFDTVDKAHIVSIIASIEVPAIEKYKPQNPELWNYAGSALYNILVEHPEIEDIIIKHNYFGIKNMKQVLDDTLSEIHVNDIKRGVE